MIKRICEYLRGNKNKELVSKIDRIIVYVCDLRKWSDEHQRDTILAIDSLKRWSLDHQATVIEMLSNIHCFMKEINGRLSALENSGQQTTSMADRLQPCSNCKNTERKKKHLSKRARSKKQEGDRSPIKIMVGGANEA